MKSGTVCTATRRDGEPCSNFARKGATVCRKHGGNAPQVLKAAQVRLLMASDRLMAQLLLIAEDKSEPTPVRLAAIRDALDRAGLGAKQQIEIEATVETWQHKVDAAVVDWGELAALMPARDPNEVDAELVEDAPRDATLDVSERPDTHRETRQAEIVAEVSRLPVPQADETPSWISPESGSQTATRRADEHRKAAFEADRAGKGLAPRTTRKR